MEKLLARLTAQSSGPNPKEPGGGIPTFTREDIALIAGRAPVMCWHALMTKYCHDVLSTRVLYEWARKHSLKELFENPKNESIEIQPRHQKRVVELCLLMFIHPQGKSWSTTSSQAQFVGMRPDTYKRKYLLHRNYLLKALEDHEVVGLSAMARFKQ